MELINNTSKTLRDDLASEPFTYTLLVLQASAASERVLNTLMAQRYLSILTSGVISSFS